MRRIILLTAFVAVALMGAGLRPANATVSQVQLDFNTAAVGTDYSAVFTAGQAFSFTETWGGYTLLVSGDTDNLYGVTPLGDNPFLSLTVQVSNVGPNPPANPITIGLSMTGLTSVPGTLIDFESSFTGIFHSTDSASFSTSFDPNNVLFGHAGSLSQFNGLSNRSNSNDQDLLAHVNSDYSMSLFITFNPVVNAHPTLDGQLTVNDVPEPGSLALLCVGVAALGRFRRRR